MTTRFRETKQKTNIQAVYEFLRSRMTPTRLVEVSGKEIQEATSLSADRVYDAIFILLRKKLIEKEQSGARYRKMVLRVLDPSVEFKLSGPKDLLQLFGDSWPCPHCGHPIDLRKAFEEKEEFLKKSLKRTAQLRGKQ